MTAPRRKVAHKGAAKPRRYPPLPKTVQGAGGTLTVELVATLTKTGDEEDTLGDFNPSTRHIRILKSLRGDQRWLVYLHELTHAALWDSGAHNALPGPAEEIVCDAISTARLREKFG